MAVAIGLDYSPLDRRQRKKVLDVVTRELLTPKGLRTLSPKSYGYRPFYLGSPYDREMALHNGPARPWLMGFYADAYLKVFGMSGSELYRQNAYRLRRRDGQRLCRVAEPALRRQSAL